MKFSDLVIRSERRLPTWLLLQNTIFINKDLFTEYTFWTIVSEVIVLTAIKYQLRNDLKDKMMIESLRKFKNVIASLLFNCDVIIYVILRLRIWVVSKLASSINCLSLRDNDGNFPSVSYLSAIRLVSSGSVKSWKYFLLQSSV